MSSSRGLRTVARGSAVAAVIVSTVGISAIPAQAAGPPSHVIENNSRCVDGDRWGKLYLSKCGSENPYQRFYREERGHYLLFGHSSSGKCLTGLGRDVDGVELRPCNEHNDQLWREDRAKHRLENFATGRCLDSKESVVYARACDGSAGQRWTVLKII